MTGRTPTFKYLSTLALLLGALGLAGCNTTGAADDQPDAVTVTAGLAQIPAETSRSVFEELAFPAGVVAPQTLKVPMLMYHHVGEPPADADDLRRGLTVTGTDFAAQMDYLKQAGYHPVSMRQLFEALYYGEPLPAKPVLLTLDDGYLDNYAVAAPILEQYGFTATFYIISGMVGQPDYMSWEQVIELDRRGMEIGSHTVSHPDLTSLGKTDLMAEVESSATTLEGQLGHPVYWFCYPAGRHDTDVIDALSLAGYLLAVTTEPGEMQSSDTPFQLPRYRVRPDTGVDGLAELVR